MKKRRFRDDRALVEACVSQDAGAWTEFVNRYSGLIRIAIDNRLRKYGIAPSPQEIEDIGQEVLASLWRRGKLETVRDRRDISYWLAIVSGNAALGYMRRRRRLEPAKSVSLFDTIGEEAAIELIPSVQTNPRDASFRNELLKKTDEAIECLPQKEKLAIKLLLIHNKEHHEIAEILKMPIGTVSSYIKRAKERLRKELKDFF